MIKKIFGLLPIVAMLFLIGCEDFAKADPDQAVVEGFLHAGRTATIKVNRQLVFAVGDTTFEQPIGGLALELFNETSGKSEKLTETDLGVYESTGRIDEGATYRLEFDYNGKNVWAQTTIPSKVVGFVGSDTALLHTKRFSEDTLRYVNYHWNNPNNDYHLVQTTNMESWTSLIYTPINNTTPSRTITSTPTQDTTHQVNSRQFSYFGRHYMILYKVNQEYVDLYYENSSNSQHLTNPATNVHNGFGIFTGMNSDTLLLRLI